MYGPHFYLKHLVAHGPIALRCVTCGRECICFDPATHGYDAELDLLPPPKADRDAEIQDLACPSCKASSFEVITRFEYPTTVHAAQSPEPSGPAEEDLFTYFMLIVTCSSCRQILPIADVQCA